ncbi:aminotransferase class V-fold PLP-dependent enzyme [Cytophagaceae bacterium YF14B1]|uniref:phosphoserine transaminase n=1 Tax=Xanthocytophaga flava TaxID=3048013 RepID=A0AAE3UDS8_9BACT|nr:aminotransferase class V-fold PLP-dependent enzyme [Xanthocytophaga flavus]MDJ1486064.1 aminotransferase class V-fold PLP-dependent enzyme [Xanthocytophaga flavus]
MITFYPGPSKVYPQVRQYMLDAYDSGILSANHRSSAFMQICEKTLGLLQAKLNIPETYSVVFVSSATESWEIIAQSFTQKSSHHYYNGAFGQKWYEYAHKIVPQTTSQAFDSNQIPLLTNVPDDCDVISLTQNETSNGTQLPAAFIESVKTTYPDKLIAVDATSSLGGVALRIEQADIWFASVQKCLGLPAGMGLLIVSPKALEHARKISDKRFYNSFLFMYDNIQKYQTHYTPNVFNIYLLMRVLESVEPLDSIADKIRQQAANWYTFFDNHPVLKPLIQNPQVRSDTVITIGATEDKITFIKQAAQKEGIVLGNGYGDWKSSTFRIANFPAITQQEISQLQTLLKDIGK